jgi:hypothetical protein
MEMWTALVMIVVAVVMVGGGRLRLGNVSDEGE